MIATSSYRRVAGVAGAVAEVQIWSAPDGTLLSTMETDNHPIAALEFSPDGFLLAAGTWGYHTYLWKSTNWERTHALPAPDHGTYNAVDSVAFSPNGSRVAAGARDGHVSVYDTATGALLADIETQGGGVRALEFLPDGDRIVAIGDDKLLRVLSGSAGTVQLTLNGHNAIGWCLNVLNDDIVLSGSVDGTIRAWCLDPSLTREIVEIPSRTESAEWSRDGRTLYTATFSPDGVLLATTSDDKTIRLWSVADGSLLRTLEGHGGATKSAEFLPDGRLVSCANDATVRVWDCGTGAEIRKSNLSEASLYRVVVSPDGKRVAASGMRVHIIDSENGTVLMKRHGHHGSIWNLAFSPDGRTLASFSTERALVLSHTESASERFAQRMAR